MPSYLCFSITFLDEQFHGRRDAGQAEWPPSPLRLFQALLAACASAWRDGRFESEAAPALRWLETQKPPLIITPAHHAGSPYRLAVPNNDLDVVASAWARNRQPSKQPNELKTLKPVRPVHLRGGDRVRYLYPLTDGLPAFPETLARAARHITHLGWGVDMVAGHGQIVGQDEAHAFQSEAGREVWRPVASGSPAPVRVHVSGTLEALSERHAAFLGRLGEDGYSPVPALTAFATVGYGRATDHAPPASAAFSILKPDASGNAAFDPARLTRQVAAWLRSATAAVCEAWPFGDTAGFVHGHAPDGAPLKGTGADARFMYLPLPTLNPTLGRAESIRRVLVAAPREFADRVEYVRRRLPGQELRATDGTARGLLNILPTSDWVLGQYTKPARVWSTVTPLVMPGSFTRSEGRKQRLLRHAFEQAGLPPELVARADIEWRDVGFRAGVDLARRYHVPANLDRLPRYHVRVRWPVAVGGPLVAGAGRYRGLGVFAAEGREVIDPAGGRG